MGATGEICQKVIDFGYNPSWSPDGTQLVVATEAVMDSVNRGRASQLWKVDIQTGTKTLLYAGDGVQPNWSPHGNRIAAGPAERPAGDKVHFSGWRESAKRSRRR